MYTPEQLRQLVLEIKRTRSENDKIGYARVMDSFNFGMKELAKTNPREATKIEAEYRTWIQKTVEADQAKFLARKKREQRNTRPRKRRL